MKEKRNNQRQASKLLRILENLIDFELIICGSQNASYCKKMQEVVSKQSKPDRYKVLNIDLSSIKEVYDFQNSLPKNAENHNAYYVINVLGLESKIEPHKPCAFLNGLNLQRDRLAEQSPYAFIFWLPEGLIRRFTLDAPDLWSWRNSVLVFMDEESSKRNTEITAQESYTDSDFSNFTVKEKKRHIEYLTDLITRLKRSGETVEIQKKTARTILDRGELFRLTGEYKKALNGFSECKEICEKLGDRKMIARSCNKIGITYSALANYKKAIIFHKKQEQICKELDDRNELAISYGNQAVILKTWGKLDEAMVLHKKEEKICNDLGDIAGLARSYGNQAVILNAWGKLDEAMALHKKEEKIFNDLGDIAGLAISWWNQGRIYGDRGDRGRKIELWGKSIDMNKSIGIPTESYEDALRKYLEEV